MPKILAIWITKLVRRASRLLGGGGGSALPGLWAERLRPRLLHELCVQLPKGVVVITGTNGKTTTTKILSQVLSENGMKVLTNRTGSNFVRGILSILIEKATLSGRLDYDVAVFELDEAYSRHFAKQVPPRLVVVLNILRDQLDRYGELDITAEMIGDTVACAEAVVLNADDSSVAQLAERLPSDTRLLWYGVDVALRKQMPSDAALHDDEIDEQFTRPNCDVELTGYHVDSDAIEAKIRIDERAHVLKLRLAGLHNAVNATAALTAATALGVGASDALVALSRVQPAFGRGEEIRYQDRMFRLDLIKNPAGFNQNIATMLSGDHPDALVVIINDEHADGRDVSWLWDVAIERLGELSDVSIFVGGKRAYDMALRLDYAGMKCTNVTTNEKDLLDKVVKNTGTLSSIRVFPTYTAMLSLRHILTKNSDADVEEVW